MAYKHGVEVSEVSTSILPPVAGSAGIPFIVGTAPVNMADVKNVNKPVLCNTYEEAVSAFGYVPPKLDSNSGLKKYEYTISEFIHSQFALFGAAPCIIVNVLDPTSMNTSTTANMVTLDNTTGEGIVEETGILPASVIIGTGSYTVGTDYTLGFNEAGYLVITSLKDGMGNWKVTTGSALSFSANKLTPSSVTDSQIIGGVDLNGKKSGFELVNECFPRFRLVPGLLLAPGYSESPSVAAVMAAKAASINEHFKAIALIDAPTQNMGVDIQYSDIPTWKNNNNIVDPLQVVCWPMVALDGVAYHLSTQLAGVIDIVDSENGDVPYVSHSNHNVQATASVLASGAEVWLGPETAAYLNGQGIVTALNFIGGWKAWGNRTACYPGNSDVKDAFIPVKRMFNWVGNSLIQTFWQSVDAPLNRRLIDTVVDSANIWLNGLTARQYIIGGRVEFLDSENPTTDLMDGIARFHVYLTPASPAREIDFILEYDPSYLASLFG